jgi:hypothetical protein
MAAVNPFSVTFERWSYEAVGDGETNEHGFAEAVSLREAIQYGLELRDISQRYAAPD